MRDDEALSPSPAGADASFFASLEEETSFIIVRHGQSEGNARKIVQGKLDLALDPTGRAQAAALAPWLAGRRPGAILTSPLRRAAETAAIIAAGSGLEPRADPLLEELEVGPFAGLSLDEAGRLYPEAYAAFLRLSWDGVPGAETSTSLFARALGAWTSLLAAAAGGATCVVAVSHGGLIQWLIKATMGVRSWMPLVSTRNCAVSELVVSPGRGRGGVPLCVWQRIDHLPDGVSEAAPPVF